MHVAAFVGVAVVPVVAYACLASLTAERATTLLVVVMGLAAVSAYALSVATARRSGRAEPAAEIDELSDRVESLSQCLVHLNVFGETLADTPDVQTLLGRMIPMVERTFDADWGRLHLVADSGGVRVVGARDGIPASAAVALRHVLASAQPVCLPHPQGETSPIAPDIAVDDAGSVMAVPLICGGRVTGALAVGARERREFSQRDTGVLSTIAAQIAVSVENAANYRKLEESYLATISALASAMEANDEYTADHAETISRMAVAVGAELGLDEAELRRLRCAGLLHDIGKIGVPQPVLHKNAALSPGDAARMAEHTVIGERIVSRAEYLRPVAPLVRASHERWDGHGYPDGLAGEEIPLASRIVFVCDAFHAMTSDRPYRRALPVTEAVDELQAQAGRQFDPRVVDVFVRVLPTLVADPEPARAT
ncbi:MAG TPA: HD domain-containing phosphohydrolase [Thermoleophilia bacterium]|nr:HD domain-containing phosphohydrolase [Thermoleophilia bacterium]